MTLRRHVLPPVGHSFTRAYTRFVTDSPTLTSLAKAGGCAAKYPAARLEKLLAGFVPVDSAELLVGLDPADDAAVYRLDDERALVFTVDFFPPVVDDPRAFGAIAATNALNDVFAMGGVPLLALSITAFPEELPTEMLGEILAGADEVVRAAGAILAGGHTIRDDEPKYGLAVVGTVHPDGIWPKSGAQAGRRALPDEAARHRARAPGAARGTRSGRRARRGRGGDAHAQPRRRRRPAAVRAERGDRRDGLRPARARVRDGLAQRRPDRARRRGASRPPSALELAEAGVRTGGDRRNRDYSGPHVESTATDAQEALAFDPQTAGGLLVSLPADKAAVLAATFAAARAAAAPDRSRPARRRASRFGERRRRSAGRASAVRTKARALEPRGLGRARFVQLATAARCFTLWVVVTSGAVVRLTASGLGCDNWPRCGDKPVSREGRARGDRVQQPPRRARRDRS